MTPTIDESVDDRTRPAASKSLSNDLIITAQVNVLNDKHQYDKIQPSSMSFITEQ